MSCEIDTSTAPSAECRQANQERLDKRVNRAAKRGDLNELQRAIEQGGRVSSRTLDIAAAFNHLELAQWLEQYQRQRGSKELFTSNAIDHCAAYDQYKMVKWLLSRGAPFTQQAVDRAAGGGQLRTLQLLFKHGGQYCSTTFIAAYRGGQKEVIQWLIDHSYVIVASEDCRSVDAGEPSDCECCSSECSDSECCSSECSDSE